VKTANKYLNFFKYYKVGGVNVTISEEIRSRVLDRGASVVGFADLSTIPEEARQGYLYGIIIGVAISPEIILGIRNGPTIEYYEEYKRLNALLNELGEYTEKILREKGYEAAAQTQRVVEVDENTRRTALPHKTVATRAGIGWIGKCALLVTQEFGSAIRISTILTNAKLEAGTPINTSKCAECSICKNTCPAGAVSGDLWEVTKYRDEFYNAHECRKTARERSGKIGIHESMCGLCILKCPWTQRYLKRGLHSITGGMELLPQAETLWEGLREYHGSISKDFSTSIRKRSFRDREADFESKASNHSFRIELIKLNAEKPPIGYSISSLSSNLLGEIESIFIEDAYRGMNIGDLLMKNALNWLNTNNARTKRISVVAGNDVLKFYEKYGFKERSLILEKVD
jgi:epoxyqueuosine reductase